MTIHALTRFCRALPIVAGVLLLLHAPTAQAEAKSAEMVFVADADGNWDIFVASADRRNPVQLTHTPYDENEPRWSPDRKKIIYSASDGRMYVIDVKTRETQELASEDEAKKKTSPCFSPDGKKIVYVRFKGKAADDTELAIFDLETSVWRTLIDQPGPQFDPDWSPNGKYIVSTTVHCTAECGRIIQELWLTSSEGGYARQLLMTNSHCMKPRWSPDGRTIAFCSDKDGNFDIWVLSLEGWKLEQLTTDPHLDTSPTGSPDGRRIAFVSARTGRMKIWIKDLETGKLSMLSPFKDKNIECRDVAW